MLAGKGQAFENANLRQNRHYLSRTWRALIAIESCKSPILLRAPAFWKRMRPFGLVRPPKSPPPAPQWMPVGLYAIQIIKEQKY
jgi:hypothetical protein